MPKIENLAGLRKIKESAAGRIAARSDGKARVLATDHTVNGKDVQGLVTGKAE